MANVLGELFSDIAQSIRSGLGGYNGTMKPVDFPGKIDEIVAMLEEEVVSRPSMDGMASTSNLKIAKGNFSPEADRTRITIEHGLGVMPDIIMVYQTGHPSGYETTEEFVEAYPILSAWGVKSTVNVTTRSGMNLPGWGFSTAYGIDDMPAEDRNAGFIYCPDEDMFQVGSTQDNSVGMAANLNYYWVAISGIGSAAAEPVVQALTVTENGTYTPPEGVDGYSPVVVNVENPGGSGGGSLPAGAYWEEDPISPPNAYPFMYFMSNGVLHCVTYNSLKGTDSTLNLYRKENSTWVLLTEQISGVFNVKDSKSIVDFNGKTYFTALTNYFYVYDGNGVITKLTNLPANIDSSVYVLFVHNGQLKYYSYSTDTVYVYNEVGDTWTAEATKVIGSSQYSTCVFSDGVNAYFAWYKDRNDGTVVYRYDSGKLTQIGSVGTKFTVFGSKLFNEKYAYGTYYDSTKKYDVIGKLNLETGVKEHVCKKPNFYNGFNTKFSIPDKVRFSGIDTNDSTTLVKNTFNLILHEVTE